MKNLLLILMSASFLTACGIQTKEHKKLNVDPELQPYVTQFQMKSGIQIDDLEVVFRPLGINENTLGYCQQSSRTVYTNGGLTRNEYNTPLIVINSDRWNYDFANSPSDRELLMFHELGHCILKRGHSNNYQTSIMYPYHLGGQRYTNRYTSYLAELFGMTSFAGTFDDSNYTNVASTYYPEFSEPEIKVLSAEELHEGCTHESHEEIHLDENGNEVQPAENK